MKVCQANLGRGVTKPVFRRNLAKLKRFAGPTAVLFPQEIDEADVPNEMDDIHWMFRWTHKVIGDGLAVPILVPKRFETFGHKVVLGAHGLAKFTPNRPINRVGIEIPLSRRAMAELGVTSLGVYAFNFHVPISAEETEERREDMLEAVTEETNDVRDTGFSGLWVADTNWRKARDGALPRITSTEKQVMGGKVGTHAEIDQAKAWAGKGSGLKVVVRNRRQVDLTIDGHNGHGADLLWTPRAA